MTHLHVWHVSLERYCSVFLRKCVTQPIYMCDVVHFVCVVWLLFLCISLSLSLSFSLFLSLSHPLSLSISLPLPLPLPFHFISLPLSTSLPLSLPSFPPPPSRSPYSRRACLCTWLIRMCDMTHWYVWLDSFVYTIWLICAQKMSSLWLWTCVYIHVDKRALHMWTKEPYICRQKSLTYVDKRASNMWTHKMSSLWLWTCLIYKYAVTPLYGTRDWYTCETHCNTLQHTAMHCNTLQHTWPIHLWNTLQHTATHCNALQHTATHVTDTPVKHDSRICKV